MTTPRRGVLVPVLLAQLDAHPRLRRVIGRELDRVIPGSKRALKRKLDRMRTQSTALSAIAGTDLGPEGLTARAARVLADLDRECYAQAAALTERAR